MLSTVSSPTDFEHMFELAPVSLWLEDYSAVRRLFDQWRAAGVVDVVQHLRQHPECVRAYGSGIRLLRVNRRTLELFAAPDQATLEASLAQVFRDDMFESAIAEIAQLWEGVSEYSNQTVNYALDGRRLDVRIRGRILPGYEDCWSRVLVSLEDVTERVLARRRLERSEQYARGLFEHSPVSLWVEDFSAVKALLDGVRAQGISDFRTFLKVHPEFVERCIREIRVLDVNQLTLTMFGADSKQALLANLDRCLKSQKMR